jgi:DNA modification methylase
MNWEILEGDCREVLASLPERSVQTVVTSPPYFGLRDYGTGEWEGGDVACDHLMTPHGRSSSTLRNDGREHTGPYEGEKATVTGTPYRDLCQKCGGRRVDRQIGLEPSPDDFVNSLVAVFREVRRVLRDDGTVWLNYRRCLPYA